MINNLNTKTNSNNTNNDNNSQQSQEAKKYFIVAAKMLPTDNRPSPRLCAAGWSDAIYYTPPSQQQQILSQPQQKQSHISYAPPLLSFARLPESSAIAAVMLTTAGVGLGSAPVDGVMERERVRVQHVQVPTTKLRHNHWETFSFLSSLNSINNNNNNNTSKDMQIVRETALGVEGVFGAEGRAVCNKKSAFMECASVRRRITTATPTITAAAAAAGTTIGAQRTEDQENAFRRIEDVHNYAKLSDRYSHGSSNSSLHDDDDDDDDDDAEGDDDIQDELLDEIAFGAAATPTGIAVIKGKSATLGPAAADETETDDMVDVETVQASGEIQLQQKQQQRPTVGSEAGAAPDHHARRPMNAFLIFCKRHRAIVKERYKTLENRAITKILGDWWASLDANDKQRFTTLAQQNKDAFFSANPNFKWYKLPAPPLRTLNTRPTNASELQQQQPQQQRPEDATLVDREYAKYFKLADETKMGELSTLLGAAVVKTGGCDTKRATSALQQELCETTAYMSAHIPAEDGTRGCLPKRRLYSEQSFSSNSSEDIDGVVPRKRSRSCKGKIYQELINSGQIAAVVKKVKVTPAMPASQAATDDHEYLLRCTESGIAQSQQQQLVVVMGGKRRVVSESSSSSSSSSTHSSDLMHFDLEERIRELPALSLDVYLQRKRNTKRKKKFNAKRRHTNNNNNSSSAIAAIGSSTAITATRNDDDDTQTPAVATTPRPPAPAVVGSQKRKARKESITRRDVSAIENEVAALLSLPSEFATIKGGYYFNEAPGSATPVVVSTANDGDGLAPLEAESFNRAGGSRSNSGFNNTNNTSSTSDLLILAEVAAKRTQLTN